MVWYNQPGKNSGKEIVMRQCRFILGGGHLPRARDGGAGFYQKLVAPYGKGAKVVICAFAREMKAWPAILEQERGLLTGLLFDPSSQVTLATVANFKSQVASADAVVLRGGDTERLLKMLNQAGDWLCDLEQKTIAGSSAGAYALASKYVKLGQIPEVCNGLGLVDVLAVAHYRSATLPGGNAFGSLDVYWTEVDRLINQVEYKNVLQLSEGEFAIIQSKT